MCIKNKFIFRWLIIPLIMLLFWFLFTILENNVVPFSILTFNSKFNTTSNNFYQPITKGQTISGEFNAKDNNLGIISINFKPMKQVSYQDEDILIFKLKEAGSKNWYSVNKYKSGLIEKNLNFPFGFPRIENSKNKIYEFSITSLRGNSINAVSIDNNYKYLITYYQYNKSELFTLKLFIPFFIKKIITVFTNPSILVVSLIYLLPLLVYITLNISIKMSKYEAMFILVFTLIYTLITKELSVYIYWTIFIVWLFLVIKFKYTSYNTFLIALIYLVISILILSFNMIRIAQVILIWAFLFLSVATISELIKARR